MINPEQVVQATNGEHAQSSSTGLSDFETTPIRSQKQSSHSIAGAQHIIAMKVIIRIERNFI